MIKIITITIEFSFYFCTYLMSNLISHRVRLHNNKLSIDITPVVFACELHKWIKSDHDKLLIIGRQYFQMHSHSHHHHLTVTDARVQ